MTKTGQDAFSDEFVMPSINAPNFGGLCEFVLEKKTRDKITN